MLNISLRYLEYIMGLCQPIFSMKFNDNGCQYNEFKQLVFILSLISSGFLSWYPFLIASERGCVREWFSEIVLEIQILEILM